MPYAALHVATEHRRVEACLALLRNGATVGPDRLKCMTCLDIAASRGYTGQLLHVLTVAEEMDARKRSCCRALYHAVDTDRHDTIHHLVALDADVEHRKQDESTNLHVAVRYGSVGSAEALLQAGANIEARFLGSTPLHLACFRICVDAVRLLLFGGADENATTSDGKYPCEIVGTLESFLGEEPPPEETASTRLKENRIRSMLQAALGDRSWRRRG